MIAFGTLHFRLAAEDFLELCPELFKLERGGGPLYAWTYLPPEYSDETGQCNSS